MRRIGIVGVGLPGSAVAERCRPVFDAIVARPSTSGPSAPRR